MSDPTSIEREIDRAREDLETNLGELKDVVQDTLNIRKQAHKAVARTKADARDFFARTRDDVREHPVAAGLMAIGVIALAAAVIMIGRRSRRAIAARSSTLPHAAESSMTGSS